MPTNEQPRPTFRQQIYFWTITVLIVVSWCILVTALAVTMIRLGIPDTSPPENFYDTGVWDTPVH